MTARAISSPRANPRATSNTPSGPDPDVVAPEAAVVGTAVGVGVAVGLAVGVAVGVGVAGLVGVIAFDLAEAGPAPAALLAWTVKVYEVPLVSPPTVQERAAVVAQVFPSGAEVTV